MKDNHSGEFKVLFLKQTIERRGQARTRKENYKNLLDAQALE